jgi:hypothetical protein
MADQVFPSSYTMLLGLRTIRGEYLGVHISNQCSIENVAVQLSLYHFVLDNQLFVMGYHFRLSLLALVSFQSNMAITMVIP